MDINYGEKLQLERAKARLILAYASGDQWEVMQKSILVEINEDNLKNVMKRHEGEKGLSIHDKEYLANPAKFEARAEEGRRKVEEMRERVRRKMEQ